MAISHTEVKSDAYSEPYGGDRASASNAAMVGVTSATGAIGGVVGSLVGESIAATQNSMFRGKSKGYFDAVQKNTPDVGTILNGYLTREIKRDAFFSGKVRNASPNAIISKITSYRLSRNGKDSSGDILLTPQVSAQIELHDGAGKTIAGGNYIGVAYSNTISVYATNPSKTKEGYEVASRAAVNSFIEALARKASE